MTTTEQMDNDTTEVPVAPRKPRRWLPWAAATGAFILGGAVGIGMAGDGETVDVTATPEYEELEASLAAQEQRASAAESALAEAEDSLAEAEDSLAERESALAEAEAAVSEREAAVTETETTVAANTVEPGYWIVGEEIDPGQYRSSSDVNGLCYTAQKDGESILWNDVADVGRPVMTVQDAPGTVVEVATECGPFQKIG